mgnify:CR=1 FL=1
MITYTKKVSFNSVNASCFEVQPCPLWATVDYSFTKYFNSGSKDAEFDPGLPVKLFTKARHCANMAAKAQAPRLA